MNMNLDLVHVPVSDVDRTKRFYTEKVGFNADPDGNSWLLQEVPAKFREAA